MQLKLDDDDDDGYHQESSSNNPYFRNENSKAPQSSAPPVAPYKSSGSNSTNSSTIYRTKQKPKYDDNATLTTAKAVAPNLTDGNLVNSDSHLNGIGDYIFLSRLGDGKFSQVMLAEHHSTGEKVAVKIINKRAHQYRVMYRLVREIQLMEVLNEHSNIVTLYETYETADALYLVMEYVPGLNLEDYLKSIATNNNSDKNKFAHLDEEKARHIFRQIVKAVDYCHSRWVVHRDLKTPNILLTGENLNQVKIADFGLGNRYGLQRLKTVCGSMLYYSPEIIAARSYIGPEVDTWCLGILLFRMTAGTELFAHAKTPAELKKYILCRQYRFPSHLSTDLQLTIQKCLSTDRANRLSLETILKQDPWFTNNGTL
ncbi:kinase-like domain-containing protein, partial [Mycotypha africana]|uniref:kinase-like domain-containing protein n=1 Tax=Mycotypha africana TaxID=64632 RepID=UPI0023006356